MNVEEALKQELGCTYIDLPFRWSRGGLNETSIVSTDRGKFFIKRHPSQSIDMYIAECKGLDTIAATNTVRVPKPYCYGVSEEGAFLIMEYVELVSHTPKSQQALGEQLAQMHLFSGPDKFGFSINNTIGTTTQVNHWCRDWIEFFLTNRLEFQFECIEKRYRDVELRREAEPLFNRFPTLFEELIIVPVLLHGDLWSGNTSCDQWGTPVIYDPAVYYGHHEAEFGIVNMFGGFCSEFYQAYESIIPRAAGFEERVQVYQLYHTLNHYFLFGSGYREACLSLLRYL